MGQRLTQRRDAKVTVTRETLYCDPSHAPEAGAVSGFEQFPAGYGRGGGPD